VLFDALIRLPEAIGAWELDIVGDGPARAQYERQAEELGIASRVLFHGIRDKKEVATFMQRADLFVLASAWENLPCVVIEALACGLPVVATAVGGIPELVCSRDGRLVPPGDPGALASALAEVLAARDRFDSSDIARRAQRFAPDRIGEAIDAVYQEIVPA
jgi:glycosyltransferase involved in cell wall biosynthesis